MSAIFFFQEDIDFILPNETGTQEWITNIATQENCSIIGINYIFCSDSEIHRINLEYLNHDTLTDIITFDNSDKPKELEADIYISIDRVRENANLFNSTFDNELHRVLIHGLLHLIGYNDKSEEEKIIMRKKEEACLSLRHNNS